MICLCYVNRVIVQIDSIHSQLSLARVGLSTYNNSNNNSNNNIVVDDLDAIEVKYI